MNTTPLSEATPADRRWLTFSYIGLVVGTLFFAGSLTPSLLPRPWIVQGILSGLALGAGYCVGVGLVLIWTSLELPRPRQRLEVISKRITTIVVLMIAGLFLWRDTVWQNSIRERMQMPVVESAYPHYVALIAALVGSSLVLISRVIMKGWMLVHARLQRIVPLRVSYILSTLLVIAGLELFVNKVVARTALDLADQIFLKLDMATDEGLQQPTISTASGSANSLIDWTTIGRQGKDFVLKGPTPEGIAEFTGKKAIQPLRVYVGLGSRPTMAEQAQLAVEELKRVGGFDRKLLVVATPTGTGWLDPGAVDTLEYLHHGDTAIVSMQYSYLPSWITILVDPRRSIDSAQALFTAVYDHWKSLPADQRPKLYLHGLSLGSLGSESATDMFTIFEDPIQGAVWSGPPFPSQMWRRITAQRKPDSPQWMPRFRDGSMVRFTGQQNLIDQAGHRWGPMRTVYIQYASDPMVFFSPDLLYRRPAWLDDPRGPDVSPYLRWYPIVTFLQIAMDLPMATSIPTGFGHNYAPVNYIEAWQAVTQPEDWNESDLERLKQFFASKPVNTP